MRVKLKAKSTFKLMRALVLFHSSLGVAFAQQGVIVIDNTGESIKENAQEKKVIIRKALRVFGAERRNVVEISVTDDKAYLTMNAIPVLQIGDLQITNSGFPGPDARTIRFTLTLKEFAGIKDGEEILFKHGLDSPDPETKHLPRRGKSFGKLDKRRVNK